MSDTLKDQIDSMSNDEPSLHKLDKKLDILIFAYTRSEKRIDDVETDVACVKEKVSKAYTAAAVVAATVSVAGGLITWLLNLGGLKHGG